MCGIFGFAFTKTLQNFKSDDYPKFLKDLFLLSQQRGQDASGIATFEIGAEVNILKKAASPRQLIKNTGYQAIERLLSTKAGQVEAGFCAIGHARMVTSGNAQEDRNNHPFRQGNVTLIHNGVICNYQDILKETAQHFPVETEVDTETLLALLRWYREIEHKNLDEALISTFARIEGTASICAIEEQLGKIILATNNGSLYFSYNEQYGALVFSSEKFILSTALEKNPKFKTVFGAIQKLAPNNALVLDLVSGDKQDIVLTYSSGTFPVQRYSFDKEGILHTIRTEDLLVYNEKLLSEIKRCTKCLLPETYPYIQFDDHGVCNYCHHMKPTVVQGQTRENLSDIINGFIEKHPDGENCVIPLSGGRDSCYGAYLLTQEFGVRPITYTYDWGMVTDLARRNIARACGELGLENILVSANIAQKLKYIRMNVSAWLKKPDLGLIPLFMAGDKHFFSWVNTIKEQNALDLNIWMMSPLENADFKEGFSGVEPHWERERTDFLSPFAKFKMLAYYGMSFLKNPAYINSSIPDTATGFWSFYFSPRNDYHNLFDFMAWDEADVHDVLYNKLGWENSADSPNSWRVGDGTAPFYNYIYTTVAGFSENDCFRSNQIRNGSITREEGMKLIMEENIPRREGLIWYLDRVGLNYADTIRKVNSIPKLYQHLI
ncbi:hypothetical protein [Terasakiella pusilla]|uniref:hypothetical protein n=1 Tax=Terasakiella pusilla TaxID=64973 RepID=UPI003AA98684